MSAKRFKQEAGPVQGAGAHDARSAASGAAGREEMPRRRAERHAAPVERGSGAYGSHASHARAMAPTEGSARAGAAAPRQSAAPRPGAAPHARRSATERFAAASEATSEQHRFPKLGGTAAINLPQGQIPRCASTLDEGVGSAFATDDAPRPIGVDPSVTGSFSTISARQGAVLSTRETAARAAEAAREGRERSQVGKPARRARSAERDARANSRRVFVAVAAIVAALALTALIALVGSCSAGGNAPVGEGGETPAITTVANNTSVDLGGYTFSTVQAEDGSWVFERTGREDPIYTFSGTPVSLSLFGGVFYIGENLPDGTWDVICYMSADGAVPSQMLNADNQPVVGAGSLASCAVEGTDLVLTDAQGAKTVVPLA